MFTLTRRHESEARALRELEEMRADIARRDQYANVPTVRRCAYKQWSPMLAQKCECWACLNKREAITSAQEALKKQRDAYHASGSARQKSRNAA